ncbi:hypothetical protein GOBAR_DD35354 [Gossypium barbadense]|nr:hypothetical protein GOBAR_DD35354 [Gossypium barbadense]
MSYVHLTGSVAQPGDVKCKGAVDSIRDGGNAQNRLGVAVVRIEATNFTTARPKGSAQYGHAGEEQHRLVCAAQKANQGLGS